MTTKHTIEKRLKRLEAEREARRMSSVDQFDGDIDEALVDEVIKLSRAQLKGLLIRFRVRFLYRFRLRCKR